MHVLEQAIAAYPNDAEFYFVMGQVYIDTRRDRTRAQEYFTKSLQAKCGSSRS